MIDWTKANRTTGFRYVRVQWPTFRELGEIENVESCEIEEDVLTSLKVTGSIDYAITEDMGDDLVRIYSDSVHGTEAETVCHATLFVSTPSATVSPTLKTGTGNMYSTLLVLQDDAPENTFVAEAGSNPVLLAKQIAESHGLSVVATPSSYTLQNPRSYDDDKYDWLGVVNDLLDVAGYSSARVDAYGNVVLAPYENPSSKAPAAVMSDTVESVSAPEFEYEIDAYSIPNVVKVTCSNANNEPMVSIAVNDDPENKLSTVSRGRRIVRRETVSEIESQEALDAKAKELLLSSMIVVEKVEIAHAWLPFDVGDAISLDYRKAGMVMKLATVKRTTTMTADLACVTTARKFVNLLEVMDE